MTPQIGTIVLSVFALLLSVVCHEWAHGYVAYRFGDNTAKSMGRLTLNPISHIDPFGTILMPAILMLTGAPVFGYAKPVPVVWHNLRNPLRDMVYVAAAGPAMNLALALVSAIVLSVLIHAGLYRPDYRSVLFHTFHYPGFADPSAGTSFAVAQPLGLLAEFGVLINVVLAVFNLLPIPPLDGGRVAVGLLPRQAAESLAMIEPYGFLIIFGLLLTGLLWSVIGPIVGTVIGVLLAVV